MINDEALATAIGSMTLAIRNLAKIVSGLTEMDEEEIIRDALAISLREINSIDLTTLQEICDQMLRNLEAAAKVVDGEHIITTEVSQREGEMPLYWRNEVSGRLGAAIGRFISGSSSEEDLRLVKDYFTQFVNASCYDNNPQHTDESRARLALLREAIANCQLTREALNEWKWQAIREGIDPL